MVLAHPGLQPLIVRHPTYAAALLSTANESDAMSESDTISSYAAVESIDDDTPLPNLNSLPPELSRPAKKIRLE